MNLLHSALTAPGPWGRTSRRMTRIILGKSQTLVSVRFIDLIIDRVQDVVSEFSSGCCGFSPLFHIA